MPFCFHSFSYFENQWVRDMSISSVENGYSSLAGIANQQTGSRVQPVSPIRRTASLHFVTSWEARVKAPAEFRSYEEDLSFCKCQGSPQALLSSVLSRAIATHQSLPARDARFCLPENGVFQPMLNPQATCPREGACPHAQ